METSTTYTLRGDLEFSSQQHLGKNYVVVKDPLTSRYFRFTENQRVLLDLLSTPSDVLSIAERASARLGASVSPSTIEAFLKSLEEKLLLDTNLVREQLDNYKGQKLESRNILYWKLMSINAERIFAWLIPRTRWAFTRGFHLFALSVIFSALILNFLHLGELSGKVQELFNLHGLFLIWLVVLCVVTMHEFAHGLTCCHFGGKVREVGFMLIYFQPAFYCDVSDSWMFTSKKQRMLVTLAGGYFQLVVWGICTWLWRITDTDTVINQLALIVIVFAGLQTLVNFNPLIKLDGYYMLSDYLEIPNLRQKALKTLWDRVAGRPEPRLSQREERAQVLYGAASMVFSTTLLIYVYQALYTWATSHYAFAGLVGFLMFSTVTLRRTAVDYFAGVRAALSRASVRKYRNAGIALAALLVMFVGHWELKIPAESRVLPRNEMTVRPETSGVVVEVLVREGRRVAKGEVLARLRDFDKQQRISDLKGQLDQKTSELALLRAGARQEEIDRKQKLVDTKKMELANARRNQEQRSALEQNLQRSQSELQLDQQTLKRTQEMWDSGLVARAELEKAQTAVTVRQREIGQIEASIRALTESSDREFDLKTRELAEAESDLRLTLVGNRPEQIREVEAEVNKLHGQVDLLEQELQKTDVRAPIDGVVSTPFVERKLNQSLSAGDELCRLVDISRVTVEMQVPEKEMADVHPGNPVMVLPRSLPTLDLKGRVDFIAPVAQSVNGQQVVVVRSELPNEGLTLKPDMTGISVIYCGDRRIIDLISRRLVRWVRTEFWALLP
jgi:multidrug efflux pump subunit AcrA (membrane-fusion protein)